MLKNALEKHLCHTCGQNQENDNVGRDGKFYF